MHCAADKYCYVGKGTWWRQSFELVTIKVVTTDIYSLDTSMWVDI